ncbi:MAG: bifunctional 5,10-methylenetetrahydrofolate dehydrogenase/5,10-methenyltetrahydrofolate cyclohydrolase [Promethearchaeota archaeon]
MKKILDGKKLADKLNSELKKKIQKTIDKTGIVPKLATILVGEDPASKIYMNIKHKTCSQVGIESSLIKLNANISKEQLVKEIEELNNNAGTHGILLQLPLPINLREHTSKFIQYIAPNKDVDGFHPLNRGKLFDYDEELAPCTPKGIIALLEDNNIEIKGKDVTIINRSNLVGKPLIFMFLKRNATVSTCHTSTKDIDGYIRRADILVVAVGRPNFITKDKINEGVIIIDVGTNRVESKLCGDVDFDGVFDKCSKITPVPGGVGPLTVAFLLQNTFLVYKRQLNIK